MATLMPVPLTPSSPIARPGLPQAGQNGRQVIGRDTANDSLLGGAGNDVLDGGRGDDRLTGGAGADLFFLSQGAGRDIITDFTVGTDKLYLMGVDARTASSALTMRDGVAGLEVRYGTSGDSVFLAGVTKLGAGDMLFSTDGNYNPATQTITPFVNMMLPKAGAGGSQIVGFNSANDLLVGTAGNDVLDGGRGDDRLAGGAGADLFFLSQGAGRDIITDFTIGTDKLYLMGVDARTVSSALTMRDGVAGLEVRYGTSGDSVFLAGVTKLGAGDMLFSTDGNYNPATQTITPFVNMMLPKAGAGGSQIVGFNSANDLLVGTAGNDVLDGGRGDDRLAGGAGADLFFLSQGAGRDIITDFTVGTDKLYLMGVDARTVSSALTMRDGVAGLEVRYGTSGDSVFLAGVTKLGAGDMLFSTDGNYNPATQTITPFVNMMLPKAGAGGSQIVGFNSANDLLVGTAGNDVLDGGRGDDRLTGGAGADLFFLSQGAGRDIITDFTVGADKLSILGVGPGSVSVAAGFRDGVAGLEVRYGTAGDSVFLVGVGKLTAGDIVSPLGAWLWA